MFSKMDAPICFPSKNPPRQFLTGLRCGRWCEREQSDRPGPQAVFRHVSVRNRSALRVRVPEFVLLTRHPAVRKFARVEYHFKPFRCDGDDRVESLGEIDFVAWATGGWPRDAYLAYECKRLNVPTRRGRRSLAPEYVKDGVCRFVTEQSSEDLPFACMLGYVLDGRVSAAEQDVQAAMLSRAALVGLANGPTQSVWWQTSVHFATAHARTRSPSAILIQHSLVSCV